MLKFRAGRLIRVDEARRGRARRARRPSRRSACVAQVPRFCRLSAPDAWPPRRFDTWTDRDSSLVSYDRHTGGQRGGESKSSQLLRRTAAREVVFATRIQPFNGTLCARKLLLARALRRSPAPLLRRARRDDNYFHRAVEPRARARTQRTRQTRATSNSTRHHGAPPPPKRSGLDKKRPGLDDMTLYHQTQTSGTPQGIRDNLKERLEAECIYTYIGNVLVAANPFTWLQIYSSEDAKRYMRQSRLDVPPHVFAVAEAAFRAMTEEEDSQCVIISGESGAGKTEASKHIQRMQGYFALCSQGNSAEVERVKKVFLESNPLSWRRSAMPRPSSTIKFNYSLARAVDA